MRKYIEKIAKRRIKETIFPDQAEILWVYLKKSNTKSSNYDPYLNVGYTITQQAPIPLKAHIRQISAESLMYRELGLVHTGAIEIVVDESDINFFKICQKIKYDNNEYTPFLDALGNKVQITKMPFNLFKIVLFRTGN